MKKICKKDRVMVISGSHKGSVGVVLKVLPNKDMVVVEGVNKVLKRSKSKGSGENNVEKEAPIHVSNVALLDPKTEKPIKIGFSFNKDKVKIRVNRKTGTEISRVF